MKQKAFLRSIAGREAQNIADRIATAAQAKVQISAESAWYLDDWDRLSRRDRLAVLFVRFGGKCVYCGQVVVIGERAFYGATIDHVVPVIAGGSDAYNNLVLACRRCNSTKKETEGTKVIPRPASPQSVS